jgi:hypothetical protein
MTVLTVTVGADITALKRGMAAAAQLVAASARRMDEHDRKGFHYRMEGIRTPAPGGYLTVRRPSCSDMCKMQYIPSSPQFNRIGKCCSLSSREVLIGGALWVSVNSVSLPEQ